MEIETKRKGKDGKPLKVKVNKHLVDCNCNECEEKKNAL